ncbi:STAS domain-containing protein [Undibacterium sp.]|uniref:STAS domain-containing protein n=1 Tax=Undibacterium sp. TaxID=1914977 RepID=UPI00374DE9B5
MGIFSLFGKKNEQKEKTSTARTSSKNSQPKGAEPSSENAVTDDAFAQSVLAQKHKARATERKIDAIEFEMSRDIVRSKPGSMRNTTIGGGPVTQAHATTIQAAPTPAKPAANTSLGRKAIPAAQLATDFQSTMPLVGPNTDYLLGSTDTLGRHDTLVAATLAPTESVPVLEEAAILFASGQSNVAEQMLSSWIHQDGLGPAAQLGWYMLFDLYQITGKQPKFEALSLEYASKFETSPPIWVDSSKQTADADTSSHPGDIPSVSFPKQLDGDIVKLLDKLQELSQKSRTIKLEFARVKQVDPAGAALLLAAIKKLNKSGHDLVLVGAHELTVSLRSILEVGRRDETEAPWLLLLEILQLLQLEQVFEETSIDYCITFEVSPPSFVAPKNKVTTSAPELEIETPSDRFMMPSVIEGKTDALIGQITEHAKQHDTVLLDCSQLERVEFGASAQLLSGLVPLATQKDTTIQFHEVNYLVMALFNAMGLKNVAAIFPRKR